VVINILNLRILITWRFVCYATYIFICGCCMMLYSFSRVRATMLRPSMRTSSIFNTQNVATRRNRVAKRTQHVAPNNVAICCAEMLRSYAFDQSLQMLGQQCWDMLCWYVAIVWPGLYASLVLSKLPACIHLTKVDIRTLSMDQFFMICLNSSAFSLLYTLESFTSKI